ncbi:MAG UNVERIFIED_CONTAM: hypothetical protein LVR29_27795 [Microcystis novacekii LVE1205-3]
MLIKLFTIDNVPLANRKRYIWLATDITTREIIGGYLGGRSCQSGEKLWAGLYHFSLFASQRMQAWQAFERGCLSWI